jgi:hypothetical protein
MLAKLSLGLGNTNKGEKLMAISKEKSSLNTLVKKAILVHLKYKSLY